MTRLNPLNHVTPLYPMLVYPRGKVTKKEVLRRRDTGDDGLRSEYLVQKIVIPINVPTPKKGEALS